MVNGSKAVPSGRYTPSGQPIYVPQRTVQTPQRTATTSKPSTSSSKASAKTTIVSAALSPEAAAKYTALQQKQRIILREDYEEERINPSVSPQPIKTSVEVIKTPKKSSIEAGYSDGSVSYITPEGQPRAVPKYSDDLKQEFVSYLDSKKRVDDGTATRQDIEKVERLGIARTGYIQPSQIKRPEDRVMTDFIAQMEVGKQAVAIKRLQEQQYKSTEQLLSEGKSPSQAANIMRGLEEVDVATYQTLTPYISEIDRFRRDVSPTFLKSQELKLKIRQKQIDEVREIQQKLQDINTIKGRVSLEAQQLRTDLKQAEKEFNYEIGAVVPEKGMFGRASDWFLESRTSLYHKTPFMERYNLMLKTNPILRTQVDLMAGIGTGLIRSGEFLKEKSSWEVQTPGKPSISGFSEGLISSGSFVKGFSDKIVHDPLPLAITAVVGAGVGFVSTVGLSSLAYTAAATSSPFIAGAATTALTSAKVGMYSVGAASVGVKGYQLLQITDSYKYGEAAGETAAFVVAGAAGFQAGRMLSPRQALSPQSAVLERASKERALGADLFVETKSVAYKTKTEPFYSQTKGTAPSKMLKAGEIKTTTPTQREVTLTQFVKMGKQQYKVTEIYQPSKDAILTILKEGKTTPFYQTAFKPSVSTITDVKLKPTEAITAKQTASIKTTAYEKSGFFPEKITSEVKLFEGYKIDDGFTTGKVTTQQVITTRQTLTKPAFTAEYGLGGKQVIPVKSTFSGEAGTPTTQIDLTPTGVRIESPGTFLQQVKVVETTTGLIKFKPTPTPSSISFNYKSLVPSRLLASKKAGLYITSTDIKSIPTPATQFKTPTQKFSVSYLKGLSPNTLLPPLFSPVYSYSQLSSQAARQYESTLSPILSLPEIQTPTPGDIMLKQEELSKEETKEEIKIVAPNIKFIADSYIDVKPTTKEIQTVTAETIQIIQPITTPSDFTPPSLHVINHIQPIKPDLPISPGFGWLPTPQREQQKPKKKLKRRGIPTGYTPSFEAILLGITGKKPTKTIYSGLDIRPIIGKEGKGIFFGVQHNVKGK
jgi:hypothetical protein